MSRTPPSAVAAGNRTPDELKAPWAQDVEAVARSLDVSVDDGLSTHEAAARLRRIGPNRLREVGRVSAWRVLAAQFASPVVILLGAAAVLSFAFAGWLEGGAIVAVLAISTLMGFVAELRGARSVEALRKLGALVTRVRRAGEVIEVPAQDLVPGDVVLLEGGDVVTADLRVASASRLLANESMLTGESLPVNKNEAAVPEDTLLAERHDLLFKGTAITRGSATALVVATGDRTELGRIARLVSEAESEQTPLEKRLEGLTRRLIVLSLGVAVLTTGLGIVTGKEWLLMIETGIALAVAAIPEGLPVVATIALARGMWRMARRNALVNRLPAVETLGATSVIFTDKTGTLTENRMTVDRLEVIEEAPAILRAAWECAVLCNNAAVSGEHESGDPLEVALLRGAFEAIGLSREEAEEQWPRAREEAFDSQSKMMATFHRDGDRYRVAVKGAAEAVLEACAREASPDGESVLTPERRSEWLAENERLAARGGRVLALADVRTDDSETDPYRDLRWLGLVSLHDPARADVPAALQECHTAGIRVIMVTGDQAGTARAIATQIGLVADPEPRVIESRELAGLLEQEDDSELLATSIYARVTPEQKLDLIARFQREGAVIAMTGDGVNDAPALKKADIGIAMGGRGTQVAREAADMVLTDDAFASIVAAIRQGRIIFNNIRAFVIYLLSCNLSEILLVGTAASLRIPMPITPLQILFLNLVTDVFPALALAMGEGDPGVMRRPPRKNGEPILARRHWQRIVFSGISMTVAVLIALLVAWGPMGRPVRESVTVSFLTLALAQLTFVVNLRARGSSLWSNSIVRNAWMGGAIALCLVLLIAAVTIPVLSRVLETTLPHASDWLLIIGASLLPVLFDLVGRWVLRKRSHDL